MLLHSKINKKLIMKYVWVRSGKSGDVEYIYYLKDGRLCLLEKYEY
jgi:hypothetical protein